MWEADFPIADTASQRLTSAQSIITDCKSEETKGSVKFPRFG
jgi:hypothetical protein